MGGGPEDPPDDAGDGAKRPGTLWRAAPVSLLPKNK